ncbi:MAG: hypothetical protein PWR13_1002 [Archaeoglobi archaeon]|nr:hypothetical protein [Archaeoglobi archaeon]
MNWDEILRDVWKVEMRKEIHENKNYLLWDESGIMALLFCHLKEAMEDYGKRYLLVPEYSLKIPENAKKCDKHRDILKRLSERSNKASKGRKVDLCIVEFKEDLNSSKMYEECTFWCFEPKTAVAFEIKFTWQEDILKSIDEDIKKLNEMIEVWGTEIAVLCLITDLKNNEDLSAFLERVGGKIKNNKERFWIAFGSWDEKEEEFWDFQEY